MNILHTETLGGWGGQQNKVVKELIATRELGHSVYLLCNPGTPIAAKARNAGIVVFEYPLNKWTCFKSIPFIMQLIRALGIDVLITHSSSDSWLGGFAGRLVRRNVKTVRERHNMHTIVGWPSKWLHRRLFQHLIAISETIKDYLVDTIRVDPKKIHMLPSVVDIDAFDQCESSIRKELNIPQDAFVFGMFSILRVNKGIYDFLEVIKKVLPKHPNTYAVFGGKTSQDRIDEFRNTLKECHVDLQYVRWTGYREDVANVMKGYDVFVFPSHTEGLGTVLLEAMACRLPLVAYDMRPMSDLISNGRNGFTAPFGDTLKMAESIETLLADRALRKQFGQESFRIVTETFDQKKMGRTIESILKAITHE